MGFDLVVHRANAFMLRGRKFHVEVDGVDVGKLKPGGRLSVDLDQGMHEVRVVVSTASSKIVEVHSGTDGSRSLVAKPADSDPEARTVRLARRDPFALTLTDGDDVSRFGPTFAQAYSSGPRSIGNPGRTRAQQVLWISTLVLGVVGFVLLPLNRDGIGFLCLIVAVLIGGSLQAGFLLDKRKGPKR